MRDFLSRYILVFSLCPLFVLCVAASYTRFVMEEDYVVSYHISCDATIDSCFVECVDDSCTEQTYYSKIEKYTPDLKAACGKDITECEAANYCHPNEQSCIMTFCDEAVDGVGSCSEPPVTLES